MNFCLLVLFSFGEDPKPLVSFFGELLFEKITLVLKIVLSKFFQREMIFRILVYASIVFFSCGFIFFAIVV